MTPAEQPGSAAAQAALWGQRASDWASPALLGTYDAERRPIGTVMTEQALASTASLGLLNRDTQTTTARPEFLNELGLIFGAVYDSAAVIPDGTPPAPVANEVTNYFPSARVVSRPS